MLNTLPDRFVDSLQSPYAPIAMSYLFALIVHQMFRMHETYSLALNIIRLLLPPIVNQYILKHLQTSTPTFLWFFSTYLVALVVHITLYRLSPFHPLAHYPGPIWYKFSKVVWAVENLYGYSHYRMKELHERFGDVVRIGPNELSICDPAAIVPILGTPGIPKSPYVVGASLERDGTDVHLPLIGVMTLAEHLPRRRPWSRALNTAALKEYRPMTRTWVTKLVEKLKLKRGEISLGVELNYFTHDFACDITFGGGSELLEKGDHDGELAGISHGVILSTFFGHLPWLGVLIPRLPGVARLLDVMMAFAHKRTDERLKQGSETRDIFSYLLNENSPDRPPPSLKQLRNEGIHAIIAGADTTSSALTSICYCIASHPVAYSMLRTEVDRVFPTGDAPLSGGEYHTMQYLNAVINESMRLFPPSPSGGSRIVPPHSDGLEIGEIIIPPGTTVWIAAYSMYRDPRNFSLPDTFWPERWLVASGHRSLEEALQMLPHGKQQASSPIQSPPMDSTFQFVHNEAAFIPFSCGPMGCAGRNLALLTLRTVISAFVKEFEISLRDGWDTDEFRRGYKDYVLAMRPDLPVVLKLREQSG